MFEKYFTPQQANRHLPLVKSIVTEIQSKAASLRELIGDKGIDANNPAHHRLMESIQDLVTELQELGCFYKDWSFEIGLVDFPAIIDDQEVMLCWRTDEPSVAWYHSLDDGFPGRKPIPDHMLADVSS